MTIPKELKELGAALGYEITDTTISKDGKTYRFDEGGTSPPCPSCGAIATSTAAGIVVTCLSTTGKCHFAERAEKIGYTVKFVDQQ